MKPDDVPPDVPPASLNPEKDPDEWVTKDEPMTGPQRSYLQTLCREAGEEFNQAWTKAEASKRIDELQQKTGRGKSGRPTAKQSINLFWTMGVYDVVVRDLSHCLGLRRLPTR